MFASRQRYLLLTLLATSYLGVVCGGPIQNEKGLVDRQATTSTATTTVQTTSQVTTASRTTTQSSGTSAASTSVATSSAASSTTSVTTTTRSSTSTQTSSTTTSHTSTTTTNTSSSSSTTTSSTTSSASATSTASSNIFSKSSPYFGYAVGVLVVVCIFGALLLVLIIRFIVQKFSKKPNPPPITANAGAWRYSQDTELYSPGAAPDSANNTVSTAQARHKGVGAEMGEAQAFLSTESVALCPPAKYTDEESDPKRHSRALSDASSSQATTTPYVQRRPMSFLHSPPATHPAFIVDRDQESNSGHGHSGAVELKAVPDVYREAQSNTTAPGPSMANMLLARAGHSDAYRQPTLGSTTMLSREASTASAYSQPSGIHTPPPMPELPLPPMSTAPQAQVQPRPRDLSPDVAAALSTMQGNPSTDTIPGGGLIHAEDNHATLRPTPGRMGWGRQAPSSIHSHSDLFFGHEQK